MAHSESAFTVIELLTSIAIMGIAAAFAAPKMEALTASFRRSSARQQFEFDIIRAKNEAAAAGGHVVLTIPVNATTYSVGVDFSPYSALNVPDTNLFSRNLPDQVTITSSQTIIFDSRGYLIDDAGDLTNTTVSMLYTGEAFYNKTIYPTGAIS